MKTTHSSTSRKKIAISALLIALVLSGVFFALEKTGVTDFIKNEEYSGPTKEEKELQKKTELDEKRDFIESPSPAPSNNQTPASSIELTAQQESDGSVTVLTKLFGVASGTCNLTITNDSGSYKNSAEVIYQPTFSSCAGFSVAKEKLGAGEWTITLTVNSEKNLEKTISYRVK